MRHLPDIAATAERVAAAYAGGEERRCETCAHGGKPFYGPECTGCPTDTPIYTYPNWKPREVKP